MFFLQRVNDLLHQWKPTSLESEDYEQALHWMDSLQKPNNYLGASYNQYLCQCYYLNSLFVFIRDFLSWFIFIVYLFRPNDRLIQNERMLDIGFLGNKVLLPAEVNCIRIDSFDKFHLSFQERKGFLKDVFPYKGRYYFKLKLLLKIGTYSYYVKKYHPQIIYCSCEYSFTSSYLTLFCHKHKIVHCNIQHGEEIPCLQSAFYIFDCMYFWHERYIEYTRRVYAVIDDYSIFKPKLLKSPYRGVDEIYDYKYFLQNQKEEIMQKVFLIMEKLKSAGYKVVVRMHPAYRNKRLELKYKELIESPEKPIEESIYETKNGISIYSTVLMQLEEAGKRIIIDDLTNPVLYSNLEKSQYHYINETKLSEIVYEKCREKYEIHI